MHPDTSSSGPDGREMLQQMLGFFDGPAFMRRAKAVEESYRILIEQLRLKRDEELGMVRLRMGQLLALAGEWDALRPLVADAAALDGLRQLYDELQPRLRLPLAPTQSQHVLRGALAELRVAMTAFNRRWLKHLQSVDLAVINGLRDGYNRHYLIEKECALGNSRVARMGFMRLEPITLTVLLEALPLLLAR